MPAAGWDGLPPVPRALDETIPLVVDDGATRGALASHARPEQLLAPLAHTISPEGPVGIVWGLVGLYPRADGPGEAAAPESDPAPSGGRIDFQAPRRTLASFADTPAPRRAMTSAPPPDVVVRRAAAVEAVPELEAKPVPEPASHVERREEPVLAAEPVVAAPEPSTPVNRSGRFKGVLGPPLTQASGAEERPRTSEPIAPAKPSTPPKPKPFVAGAGPEPRESTGGHHEVTESRGPADGPLLGEEPPPATLPFGDEPEPGGENEPKRGPDAIRAGEATPPPPRRAPLGDSAVPSRPGPPTAEPDAPRAAPLPDDIPIKPAGAHRPDESAPDPSEAATPHERSAPLLGDAVPITPDEKAPDPSAPPTDEPATPPERPAPVPRDTFVPISPDEKTPNPSAPRTDEPATPPERPAPVLRDTFVPIPPDEKAPKPSTSATGEPATPPERSAPLLGDTFVPTAPGESASSSPVPAHESAIPERSAPLLGETFVPTAPGESASSSSEPPEETATPPDRSAPVLRDTFVPVPPDESASSSSVPAREARTPAPLLGETFGPIAPNESAPPVVSAIEAERSAPLLGDTFVPITDAGPARPDENPSPPDTIAEREISAPSLGDELGPRTAVEGPRHEPATGEVKPPAPKPAPLALGAEPVPPAAPPEREPGATPGDSAPLLGETIVTGTLEAPAPEASRQDDVPPSPGDTFVAGTPVRDTSVAATPEVPGSGASRELDASAPLLGEVPVTPTTPEARRRDAFVTDTPKAQRPAPSQEHAASAPLLGDTNRSVASPRNVEAAEETQTSAIVREDAVRRVPQPQREAPLLGETFVPGAPADTYAGKADAPPPGDAETRPSLRATLRELGIPVDVPPADREIESGARPGAPAPSLRAFLERSGAPVDATGEPTGSRHQAPIEVSSKERDASPGTGDAQAPLLGTPPLPPAPGSDTSPASEPETATKASRADHGRRLPAVPPPTPERGPRPERAVVPDRVLRTVQDATSVDLGDVDVVRGPDSARAAATLGAAAFVHAGVVHLPRALGPLETEPARGVLAHELVHVAQQRSHPGPLPSEESPEGRALERQAERIAAKTLETLETPKPRAGRVALPDLPPELARVDHSGALVFSPPALPPAAPMPAAPAAPKSAPVQRKPADEAADAPAEAEAPQLDLDDLARRLYPRIRPYLRKELSLDRERAAMTLGTSR